MINFKLNILLNLKIIVNYECFDKVWVKTIPYQFGFTELNPLKLIENKLHLVPFFTNKITKGSLTENVSTSAKERQLMNSSSFSVASIMEIYLYIV